MPALQSMLALPALYRLFGRLVGRLVGRDARERFIGDYVRPRPGDRVLDLGCGPGDLLAYLPPCDYVGVDLDPNYVAAAQARFGTRGTFRCEPAEAVVDYDPAVFDLVVTSGHLHHLDDAQAAPAVARRALKPGGRLVTLDGVFVPDPAVVPHALHRMIRIPYTHLVLECTAGAGG